MVGQSALLGSPPATPDDKLTYVAIKALAGSEFFPNKAKPYGEPKPSPDAPNPWDGGQVVGLSFFFIFFLLFFVVGRLVIRWRQTKVNFGLDDLFIIPSAATAIVCDAIVIYISYEECYGHHIYWCSYANFANLYEALYVNQTIFWLALYFAKISIVFFNRRLTALAQGWWKKGHWVVLGIIIACFILALFSTIFECQPVKAHYNMHALGSTLLEDPKRLHCVDSTKLELANRWLHVATDLMLLMVPLFILYRLQMPLRKKLSVGFLFCFGIICCVASIMRNEVWTHPSSDFTYDSRALLVWDLIDVNFAPIVACLPVYYPVVNFLFRDLKSRFTSLTHPGASTSSHKNASQNSQSSTNSVAKIKDRLFQGGHHQNAHVAAASEVQGIRGPYARADDEGGTELGAINVERGVTVTRDRKGSLFERPPRDFFEPEGTYHTAVQARR